MPTGPRPSPPTRFCRLAFEGSYGDTHWANIMWLFLTGSGEITVADLNTLASKCSLAWTTHFSGFQVPECQLVTTRVALYAGGGDVLEGIDTPGHAGTGSGVGLPANVAMTISWSIAPSYRGGHPRTYMAGMSEDYRLTPSSWKAASAALLTSEAVSFHGALEAITGVGSGISSVEHGVASFVRNKEWRTPPVFYRIASASVDSRIDTQRRRLGPDR